MSDMLPRGVVRRSVEFVYGDPARVTSEVVDRHFELATREGNREALVQRFEQVQGELHLERLKGLTQPTLILWGGRDRLIRPEFGDRFHRDIPDSRLVVFDDLGHIPQEEDPARTLAALEGFLRETEEPVDAATGKQ
jgi:pimeloyl-ACP methyl ester carboxylesterase